MESQNWKKNNFEHVRDCVIFKLNMEELLSSDVMEKISYTKLEQLKQDRCRIHKSFINKTSTGSAHAQVGYEDMKLDRRPGSMKKIAGKFLGYW